ncbi:hypothetical protein HDV02_002925 [Globomyces sp. JEL0801]|nr:hypothetical protein HDV02_002925 [Globomyces sp. JEL0801]
MADNNNDTDFKERYFESLEIQLKQLKTINAQAEKIESLESKCNEYTLTVASLKKQLQLLELKKPSGQSGAFPSPAYSEIHQSSSNSQNDTVDSSKRNIRIDPDHDISVTESFDADVENLLGLRNSAYELPAFRQSETGSEDPIATKEGESKKMCEKCNTVITDEFKADPFFTGRYQCKPCRKKPKALNSDNFKSPLRSSFRSPAPAPFQSPSLPPFQSSPQTAFRSPAPSPYHSPAPGPYKSPAPGPYQSPAPGPYQSPVPGPYQSPAPGPYQSPAPGPYQSPAPGPYQSPAPGAYQSPAPGPYQSPAPGPYQTPAAGTGAHHSPAPAPYRTPATGPSQSSAQRSYRSPAPLPYRSPAQGPYQNPGNSSYKSPAPLPYQSPAQAPFQSPPPQDYQSPKLETSTPEGSPNLNSNVITQYQLCSNCNALHSSGNWGNDPKNLCKKCYKNSNGQKSVPVRKCNKCSTATTSKWYTDRFHPGAHICKSCYSRRRASAKFDGIETERCCTSCNTSKSQTWYQDSFSLKGFICTVCYQSRKQMKAKANITPNNHS